MRSSDVPSRSNDRYTTHGFISFFKNTNPRNFSCRCSKASDNSHNVRFWQLNNVSTWPGKVPGVRTATFNTSVVAPSSFLNWLMAGTVVTVSSSISRKEIILIRIKLLRLLKKTIMSRSHFLIWLFSCNHQMLMTVSC